MSGTVNSQSEKVVDVLLETRDLSKFYSIGERRINVLKSVSLTIKEGEFVVVSGSSGSGKTTLLSLLSGLDRPSSGAIFLDGRDMTSLSEDQLAPVRNSLTGFVFQSFHLIPSLNSLENIMFPAELKGDRLAKMKAEELLERVGLSQRWNSFPEQLSGGEKQRVAICRALINEPKIVFADEPTGNLDSGNSDGIIELMMSIHKDQKTTFVMATHNSVIAAKADRVFCLHDGRLTLER